MLDTAHKPAAVDSLAIPADLVPLIERTFRYTYMLGTQMREDLIRNGQDDKLEYLIEKARNLRTPSGAPRRNEFKRYCGPHRAFRLATPSKGKPSINRSRRQSIRSRGSVPERVSTPL